MVHCCSLPIDSAPVVAVEVALLGASVSCICVVIVSALARIIIVVVVVAVAVLRKRVLTALVLLPIKVLLLNQDSVQLDIAVVHHKVFRHEAFEDVAFDDVEGAVLAEAPHEILNAPLVGFPLFHMSLHLHLGVRKLLVKLFEVGLWLNHECLLSDVGERLGNNFVEAAGLLD